MLLFYEQAPFVCHCAIALPRLILRSGIEEIAKDERRMNEQPTKEHRAFALSFHKDTKKEMTPTSLFTTSFITHINLRYLAFLLCIIIF